MVRVAHAGWSVLVAALGAAGGALAQNTPSPASPAVPDRLLDERPSIAAQPPLTAGSDGAATPDHVTTFADTIALAYARNPQLLAERANVRSIDYRLPQARGAYGPRLDVQAFQSFQRDRTEIASNVIGNQGWSTTAQAVLTQPLLTFGRLSAAEGDAVARIAFAHANLRFVESDVLLRTVAAYVAVQRDEALAAITEENLALLERELTDNQERFRVREITSSDLQQVQTRVEFGRAQLIAAEGRVTASRGSFLRSVGALPGALASAPRLVVPAGTLEEAAAAADSENPLIDAAQARERIARAAVAAAEAEFLPRVDARGTGAYGTLSPYSNDNRTTQIRGEFVLTVPLADSGVREASLRGAREAREAERLLIAETHRQVREQVTTAWSTLVSARQSLLRYAAASDAARRAYDGAVLQERAGARTTLDVLNLARDLLTVRSGYLEAIADDYIARAQVLAAMGRLEGKFLLPGEWLHVPGVHRDEVARNADIPLITSLLSKVDGAFVGDLRTNLTVSDYAADLLASPGNPLPADTVPPIRQ